MVGATSVSRFIGKNKSMLPSPTNNRLLFEKWLRVGKSDDLPEALKIRLTV